MDVPVVTGFRKQPFRRKALKSYFTRMSKDNPSELWDDNIAAILEQQGFQIKKQPRSVYTASKLYSALQEFSPERAPRIKLTRDVYAGIRFAYSCFSRPEGVKPFRIRRFSVPFIESIVTKPKASAGLTAWGQTKAEAKTRAYYRGLQIMQGIKAPDPCIALARTQKEGKTRLVWGYPFAMTAIEGLFARPIIDQLKGGAYPMAFGMTDGMLGAKMRVSAYNKDYAYSVDVHQFDASASKYLINVAFDIIATWFDMDWLEPQSGLRAYQIFEIIRKYFITTPIVMPDGYIYFGKRHGVPSGSYFTQLVDSIINTIYMGTFSSKFGLSLNKNDCSVLGDDSLFWSNKSISLEEVTQYASQMFDAEFQPAKSAKTYYTQPVRYLGRYWVHGEPTLPRDEIVAKAVQPERYRKYSKDPKERKHQEALLLMSYASVYHNFFWDAFRALGYVRRPNSTILSNTLRIAGNRSPVLEETSFLSGYQRFQREYGDLDLSEASDFVIQAWK